MTMPARVSLVQDYMQLQTRIFTMYRNVVIEYLCETPKFYTAMFAFSYRFFEQNKVQEYCDTVPLISVFKFLAVLPL